MSWQEVAIILGSIAGGILALWLLFMVGAFMWMFLQERREERDFEEFRNKGPLGHNWRTTDRQRPGRRLRR